MIPYPQSKYKAESALIYPHVSSSFTFKLNNEQETTEFSLSDQRYAVSIWELNKILKDKGVFVVPLDGKSMLFLSTSYTTKNCNIYFKTTDHIGIKGHYFSSDPKLYKSNTVVLPNKFIKENNSFTAVDSVQIDNITEKIQYEFVISDTVDNLKSFLPTKFKLLLSYVDEQPVTIEGFVVNDVPITINVPRTKGESTVATDQKVLKELTTKLGDTFTIEVDEGTVIFTSKKQFTFVQLPKTSLLTVEQGYVFDLQTSYGLIMEN